MYQNTRHFPVALKAECDYFTASALSDAPDKRRLNKPTFKCLEWLHSAASACAAVAERLAVMGPARAVCSLRSPRTLYSVPHPGKSSPLGRCCGRAAPPTARHATAAGEQQLAINRPRICNGRRLMQTSPTGVPLNKLHVTSDAAQRPMIHVLTVKQMKQCYKLDLCYFFVA